MDMLERLLYKQGQHSKAGAVLGEVHEQRSSNEDIFPDMDSWLTRKTGSIQASHMVAHQRKRKANFD